MKHPRNRKPCRTGTTYENRLRYVLFRKSVSLNRGIRLLGIDTVSVRLLRVPCDDSCRTGEWRLHTQFGQKRDSSTTILPNQVRTASLRQAVRRLIFSRPCAVQHPQDRFTSDPTINLGAGPRNQAQQRSWPQLVNVLHPEALVGLLIKLRSAMKIRIVSQVPFSAPDNRQTDLAIYRFSLLPLRKQLIQLPLIRVIIQISM